MMIIMQGDDSYSIRKAIRAITREGGFEDLDVMRLDARTAGSQNILMTIGTPGLFTERRLVLIEALGVGKEGRGRSKAKTTDDSLTLTDIKAVIPTSTTVVVIIGDKVDPAYIKEARSIAQKGAVELRAFPAPKQKDMARWISDRAREQKIAAEPKAIHQLAQRVGDDTTLAGTELEKLATAAGKDGKITTRMVEALVAKSVEESIFPLVDAVATGHLANTLTLLAAQMAQSDGKETELTLQLIRLLARQFRILLQIRLLLAQGTRRDEIISTLKIPEYYAERYFGQAKRLTEAQLSRALRRLAETEQAMKNGDAGDAELHLLLADLTQTSAVIVPVLRR